MRRGAAVWLGMLCAVLVLTGQSATAMPRATSTADAGLVVQASTRSAAKASVSALLAAVAANKSSAAQRRLIQGSSGKAIWRALREARAGQRRLPTSPPSTGGPWRRAARPWATAGATSCHGAYCAVALNLNALGTDGPYTTLYTKRSGGRVRTVATRSIGPQDGIDYSSAYWACTARATSLTNPALGGGTSRLRLAHRALVQVGSYYLEQPSDPQRAVRYSRVVEGYVRASAILLVPSTVSGESRARAWCRANA